MMPAHCILLHDIPLHLRCEEVVAALTAPFGWLVSTEIPPIGLPDVSTVRVNILPLPGSRLPKVVFLSPAGHPSASGSQSVHRQGGHGLVWWPPVTLWLIRRKAAAGMTSAGKVCCPHVVQRHLLPQQLSPPPCVPPTTQTSLSLTTQRLNLTPMNPPRPQITNYGPRPTDTHLESNHPSHTSTQAAPPGGTPSSQFDHPPSPPSTCHPELQRATKTSSPQHS